MVGMLSREGLQLLEGDVGFVGAFNGGIPTDGVFYFALQLRDDRAWLYSSHTGMEHNQYYKAGASLSIQL